MIASELLIMQKTKRRFGRTHAKSYREQIDSAPLTIFTPQSLQRWRIAYVGRAGNNPAKQCSARISCNSLIRQSKALFSRKIVKTIGDVTLPSPIPFAEVAFFPRESMRYSSKIDATALLRTAQNELLTSDPEAFKALILAFGVGLRRAEVDSLLWKQIDFAAGLIHIRATEAGALKTPDSTASVAIDDTLVAFLRGFAARTHGPYVLEGRIGDPVSVQWGRRYRCEETFARLIRWLREHGVEDRTPIHSLRKEAGSLVHSKAGLVAASRFLRHSDTQVTAQFYIDLKERVTVPLGALLGADNVIDIPLPAPAQKQKASNS
jgi:integrase